MHTLLSFSSLQIQSLPWRQLPASSNFLSNSKTHNRIPSCSNIRNSFSANSSLLMSKGLRSSSHRPVVEEEDDDDDEDEEEGEDGFPNRYGWRGRQKKEEMDFDRDPEIADIIGTFVDDPQKAQSRVEERMRKKRNKILQTKAGTATPMKVTFKKFDFSNSYIWFEFYHPPAQKDVTLLCDTIRAWHIVGRLGGCNSMNMQLSQSPAEKKPNYDAIQGANVSPTTFYNIGDLEVQENLARIWVDIGTDEPLLLDILINALINLNTDYFGIKQLVFGGSEFEDWKEGLRDDDEAGCSVHKI